MRATRSASARRPWSGISAATRSKPISASSAATAKPRRWSIRSTRSASTCSGVFGRGLFQTLYEPPSSLAQFLPLTFEWNVVAIVLALVGLVAGGWMLLFLVPLVVTWVLCINGALRAPIDKRFRGVKARALVALLIYLGPIVRGWERLKWRWRDLKTADSTGGLDPTMQEPRIDWRERAFYLSYWSEKSDEKEALLGELMRFLAPQKYFIQVDQGWNDWDLKIARGLWSRAYLLVC